MSDKAGTVYKDDGTPSSIAAMVTTKWRASKDLKLRHERNWSLNMAFCAGDQWVSLNRVNNKLEPIQSEAWRVRITTNLCLAWCRTALGAFSGSRPSWTVVPKSADNDAKMAADLADKSLHGQWTRLKMDIKLLRAIDWMLRTGKCFLKVYWDPNAGDEIHTMQPVLGEDGQPAMEPHPSFAHLAGGDPMASGDPASMGPGLSPSEPGSSAPVDPSAPPMGAPPFQIPMVPQMALQPSGMKTGDIAVEVVSSFEVYQDPGAYNVDDCRWLIHSKVESLDVVKATYGEAAADLKAEDMEQDDPMRRRLMAGYYSANATSVAPELMNRVVLKEYWERPSVEYPKGRRIVVANGEVLFNDVIPEGYVHIPFFELDEIPLPDQFWSQSTVQHIRPINKLYNKIRSQVAEVMNLMSKPKWLVHKGSQIADSSITSQPGEVIQFVSVNGHVPTMIPPPSLPNYVEAHLQRTLDDYMEVSGAHEATRGVAPVNRGSGRLANILQQADESRFGPVALRIEKCLEGVASAVLQLQAQYYDEERNLSVVGRDRTAEVMAFKGADLKGTYQVDIQMGSSLPMSKPNLRDFLMQLVDKQMIAPPQALKLLDMPTLDTLQEDTYLDQAYAREENEKMAQGIPAQPKPWEDSMIHGEEHERFMRSAKFRGLPPELQQLFTQHWMDTMHMVGMRQQIIAQATQPPPPPGMGPPGAPPGGPPGPPPGHPNGPPPSAPHTMEQAHHLPPVPKTPAGDPHGG